MAYLQTNYFTMEVELNNINDWILYRSKRGKLTFSRQELVADFSYLSEQTIKNNLNLLIKKGEIFPVFKGFYSVIPVDYALLNINEICKRVIAQQAVWRNGGINLV